MHSLVQTRRSVLCGVVSHMVLLSLEQGGQIYGKTRNAMPVISPLSDFALWCEISFLSNSIQYVHRWYCQQKHSRYGRKVHLQRLLPLPQWRKLNAPNFHQVAAASPWSGAILRPLGSDSFRVVNFILLSQYITCILPLSTLSMGKHWLGKELDH